jgi:hypothetical protein
VEETVLLTAGGIASGRLDGDVNGQGTEDLARRESGQLERHHG